MRRCSTCDRHQAPLCGRVVSLIWPDRFETVVYAEFVQLKMQVKKHSGCHFVSVARIAKLHVHTSGNA